MAIKWHKGNWAEKALKEEQLQRLLRALEEPTGSWKDEAHPELRELEDVRRLRVAGGVLERGSGEAKAQEKPSSPGPW